MIKRDYTDYESKNTLIAYYYKVHNHVNGEEI